MFSIRRAPRWFAFAVVLGFFATVQAGAVRHIPAEDFGKLPVLQSVQISPSGKAIAMLKPIGEKNELLIITLDGSAKPNAAAFGDFDADWFLWVNDDYVLVRTSKATERVRGGTHYRTRDTRLVSVHRTGASQPQIMMEPEKGVGVTKGGREEWKINQGYFFHVLPEEPDHFLAIFEDAVVKVSIRTGNFNAIKSVQSVHTNGLYPDLQGNVRMRSSDQDKIFYIDDKGFEREVTIFETNFKDGEGFNVTFDKNPRFGYSIILDEEEDMDRVVYVDLVEDKILKQVYARDDVELDNIRVHTRSGQIIGIDYVVDRREIHFLNAEWKRRHDVLDGAFPNLAPRIVSSTDDLKKHIVIVESPFVPATYYLFDETRGSVAMLGNAYPQFKSEELAEVRAIAYQARDGQTIHGYLTIPVGKQPKNLPMITMPHGGPEARDSMGFDYLAQFFANRGYLVFQPNFRGSDGYGEKFADAGRGEWGGRMSDDVTDGVHKLIELGVADASRMCIMGWSYGGYAAQIATVVTPDLYNCAISVNGVSDLPDMLDYEAKGNSGNTYTARDYWTDHIGHRHKDSSKIIAASPARQVGKIRMPLLLIHAEGDRIVPVEQSRKMASAMKSAGKTVKLVEFEGGDHSLRLESSRVQAMVEMDKFLKTYMNP